MSILVTGSVAIDHLMTFKGRFGDIILPDKIHMLNVAFHVPSLRRTYGGCAANIAFNLKLLGEEPVIAATVGADFGAYGDWFDQYGITRDYVRELDDEMTAGAFITTDLDDNQIIGFHSGAMDRAHEIRLEQVERPYELGIVSPNGKRAMLEYGRGLKEHGIPVVIDPGQGIPQFNSDELVELITGASTYIVNDYEWELTLEKTGLDQRAISELAETVVVTLGEKGSRLTHAGETMLVPAVASDRVVDPTGCGDAYRAGYLFALSRGFSLHYAACLGSAMGSLLVERDGTQIPDFNLEVIMERYTKGFGAFPF